ncbi:fimbrial protein [Frateuria sp. Soil773]|uniref:fimbrial protein n=1 Tax=Frateuria sp. Soil773 TaxID=1736407 RepID=UPI0006F73E74|nr:fimbrial protein [Frateuria sp. Soil773]KRE99480.1 fimbrial protein [Frateuria sp. Soil773]
MKTSILSAALAVSLGVFALSPSSAKAADGTITFNGKITGQTCDINGNGTGGKDFTVTLPTVSKSTLTNAGDWAGRTPFSIALSNCSPATGNVATYFEPGASVDLATGQLIVDSGANAATNVELGLLNGDTTAISVGATTSGADSSNSKPVALSNGAATLNYYVQYVAHQGSATEGDVASRVQYTIVYN